MATEGEQDCLLGKNGSVTKPKSQDLSLEPIQPMGVVSLEEYLRRADSNVLRILNLNEGQLLKFNQTTIQVQGAAGATQRLSVNGKIIDDKHIGKRAILAEQQKQGLEYVGVPLETGSNTLLVEQLDLMGNVREAQTLQVIVPGQAHHLELQQPIAAAVANGQDVLSIAVKIKDEQGVSVLTRTPITIASDIGVIDLADANPNEAGLQTFIENGELIIPILAPNMPGRGTLMVSSGLIQQEIDIQFTADLRPLIAVGLIEGSINFNHFDRENCIV